LENGEEKVEAGQELVNVAVVPYARIIGATPSDLESQGYVYKVGACFELFMFVTPFV
jgi:hypothetical protein